MIDAIWTIDGVEHYVVVTGYLGSQDGNDYVSIEGSSTGVPINELRVIDPESRFIGLWVDSHGRLNTTE